ncbi:hypothetical protein EUGRSUZ_H00384 [Eucalyptus grandis]|uniref:Uncharacterized protein n=2 Tax=Eucalyptus grandis TaxID=71139 RepID=A0A059AVE5_EUCGR|nr:hypothetical protein EUGRSUZ_H00384 [Eucalyptus grandis]
MPSSSKDMRDWFHHVQTNFNEELKKDIPSNVCVFQVPKSVSSTKPQAYTPQLVGLGPYHHLQPQLREMERVKLDVVKNLQKEFQHLSFAELKSTLSKLDIYIRTCYHKFLVMETDMLLWIMTVDALFLFDLLCQHGINKKTLQSSPYLQGLADHAGKKLTEDAILRDVMMLENQIPIFFTEKMLTVGCLPLQVAERKTIVEGTFPLMLVGFCKALSPLKETIDYDLAKVLKRAHLLDLLYSMVVPRQDEFKISIPADIIDMEKHDSGPARPELMSARPVCYSVEISTSTLLGSTSTLLETIMPHAQMLKGLADLYHQLKSSLDSSRNEEASPEEKALIPTASSLAKAGVKFSQTRFIKDIRFEERTCTLQLPEIQLGVNSEVVIRNLVAYEAMAISGPLVFARFVELMDGLIDTPDDVKLLRKGSIITGHLKDDDVTRLFNGMSDSIEVNGDCELDKTIKKVNEFYNAAPSIKTQNMIERYVYRAWKVLVMVATILFFLLMALQTFCSAYGCSSSSNKTTKHDPASISAHQISSIL